MNKTITFKTSTYCGDLIYLLAGIKQACINLKARAEIYLWLNRPGKSYDGAVHPYGDMMLNEYTLKMIKPLLESQDYVALVAEWKGQQITVDLDELRTKVIAPMPYGSIARWAGCAWPDMQGDLSNYWIKVITKAYAPDGIKTILIKNTGTIEYAPPQITRGKIVINRTSRYQNTMVHYWFLRDVAKDLVFAGLPEEHAAFCKEWELDIPLLKVNDFFELAVALSSCRYFIGNQSMCFALAEAMKIPRLLEICPFAPNVIPCGEYGYDFNHQFALEWFVKNEASPLNKL